jgi:plasmid stabilization system protein ParE
VARFELLLQAKMKVRWTTEATDHLEHIYRHIEEDDPEATLRTVRAIFERF